MVCEYFIVVPKFAMDQKRLKKEPSTTHLHKTFQILCNKFDYYTTLSGQILFLK